MARLAGLPDSVLLRADVFAKRIETEHDRRTLARVGGAAGALHPEQLALLRQLSSAFHSKANTGNGNGPELDVLQLWRTVHAVSS